MLTLATLGMVAYGSYSVVLGVTDLLPGPVRYAWWADVWLVGAGGVLVLASAFVRVSMPGGLALAVAGLFALQSSFRAYIEQILVPTLQRGPQGKLAHREPTLRPRVPAGRDRASGLRDRPGRARVLRVGGPRSGHRSPRPSEGLNACLRPCYLGAATRRTAVHALVARATPDHDGSAG